MVRLLVVGKEDGRGGHVDLPVLPQPVFRDRPAFANELRDELVEARVEVLRGLFDRRGPRPLAGLLQHLGKLVGLGPECLDPAGQVIAGVIRMAVDQPSRVVGQGGEGAIARRQGRPDHDGLAQGPAVAGLGGLEVFPGQLPRPFVGGEEPILTGPAVVVGLLDDGPGPGVDLLAVGVAIHLRRHAHRGALGQDADAQGLGRQPPERPPVDPPAEATGASAGSEPWPGAARPRARPAGCGPRREPAP